MIRRQCVCSADCIHFQLDTSKIFIEPLAKVNLKRVTHHEKLIMWNRWGGITRVFQMGVSPPAAEGQVCADYEEDHVTTVVCGFSAGTSKHKCEPIHQTPADTGRQTRTQTCCSYFCLSASSCSEKSLACFSLRDLERVRSSSTFSI